MGRVHKIPGAVLTFLHGKGSHGNPTSEVFQEYHGLTFGEGRTVPLVRVGLYLNCFNSCFLSCGACAHLSLL